MLGVVGYYILFLVIGFIGGLFCPYESVITGYANDPFRWDFVYSYQHDRDPMELLLFISVPILVVALIVLIIKTYVDIGKHREEHEEYNGEDIEKLKQRYKETCDKSENYKDAMALLNGLNIIFFILSIFGIGFVLLVLNWVVIGGLFIRKKFNDAKADRLGEKLKSLGVDISDLICDKNNKQEQKG